MNSPSTANQPGLLELFQGEVLGEVFFNTMLSNHDQPQQQYKLATLLPLETETKARLRSVMYPLGMDLRESQEPRDQALQLVASMEGSDWTQFLTTLAGTLTPFVDRCKDLTAAAPEDLKDIFNAMVIHEQSLPTFTQMELAGDTDHSLDAAIKQLVYPLRKPMH